MPALFPQSTRGGATGFYGLGWIGVLYPLATLVTGTLDDTQFPLHLSPILHPPRCVCPTVCPPMFLQPLSHCLAWPALTTLGVSSLVKLCLGAQLDLQTN